MKGINQIKNAKGFTLIELLIVVAIIGILAAIAIPQYQTYVGKSDVGSAIGTMNSLKAPVEAYILTEGEWPTSLTAVQGNDPSNGTITLTDGNMELLFTEGSPDIKGQKVNFARDSDGVWSCNTATIDDKYLPPLCRAVAAAVTP